jgi:hypothetical protein
MYINNQKNLIYNNKHIVIKKTKIFLHHCTCKPQFIQIDKNKMKISKYKMSNKSKALV